MPKPAKSAVARRKSAAPPRKKTTAAKPASARSSGKAATGSAGTDTNAAKGSGQARRARNPGPSVTDAADRFLEEQRGLLAAEREASLRQANALRAEAEQLAEEMEPGDTQFDEESGEGGTLNVERERDLALSAQAQAAVEEVDRALERIAAGKYGTCEQCGQPIPKARLKAMPHATLCVACKSGGLSRR
jgi:DnaK suppressor protein